MPDPSPTPGRRRDGHHLRVTWHGWGDASSVAATTDTSSGVHHSTSAGAVPVALVGAQDVAPRSYAGVAVYAVLVVG